MNNTDKVSDHALQLFEPDPDVVYTIETTANLTHVGRRNILVYYKQGLLPSVLAPESGGYYFNDEAIRVLRRIGHLQTDHGITPIKVGGGSVKVKDKLKISFTIVATKAN